MTQRYFIYLAYNGSKFCGWQIQPHDPSVQECIEDALGKLMRTPTPIVGAGRTDSGVHAQKMIAHFDYTGEAPLDTTNLCRKLNIMLPKEIAIYDIVPVKPDAHARFDATARAYKYYITEKKDPFNFDFVYRHGTPLDYQAMNEAAKRLFDYEDFTSFSKLHTDVKTNNCTIMRAEWIQEGDIWVFNIKANRFLRNMVRAIVGTLLMVGRGKITADEFCKIIESKDRGKAGTSAPGHALYLVDVEYPQEIFIENK